MNESCSKHISIILTLNFEFNAGSVLRTSIKLGSIEIFILQHKIIGSVIYLVCRPS